MRISDWSSDVCSSDLCRSLKTREIDDIDAAAPAVDQPVVLKCRVGDCNRRTLDAKNVGKLLLRQRQMRALVSARRGIEKNPAHAHFHSMDGGAGDERSEEHTSELQSLMRISYAVFCLKKKKTHSCTMQTNKL